MSPSTAGAPRQEMPGGFCSEVPAPSAGLSGTLPAVRGREGTPGPGGGFVGGVWLGCADTAFEMARFEEGGTGPFGSDRLFLLITVFNEIHG